MGKVFDKNIYYLQQMGIDVWKLRNLKKKILVLIFPFAKQLELARNAQNLLENILTSTRIKRADFELMFVKEAPSLDAKFVENFDYFFKNNRIDLQQYNAVILMGENLEINDIFQATMQKLGVLVIKTFHPYHLLTNPQDKRLVYLSLGLLRELEFKNV